MEVMEKIEHVVSKETYIAMKNYEKDVVRYRKDAKKNIKAWHEENRKYYEALNEYYKHPNAIGSVQPKSPSSAVVVVSKEEARAFYILYGFVKGKKYEDVEGNAKKFESSYDHTLREIQQGMTKWEQLFQLPSEKIKEYLRTSQFR